MKFQFPPSCHLNLLLITYLVLTIGYQSHSILGNFAIGPALCIKLCLMYSQMGNFQYFSLCLAHWLFKPWHFGKFHHWPCCVHQIMSHVWPNGKFLIFLFLLVHWLSKPWHFGKFCCFPPKSAISQTSQNKFNSLIPPSYGLHFGKYKMGIIGVKYTIFMQNAM